MTSHRIILAIAKPSLLADELAAISYGYNLKCFIHTPDEGFTSCSSYVTAGLDFV